MENASELDPDVIPNSDQKLNIGVKKSITEIEKESREAVITSYSIHYTKLYDRLIHVLP